jgi:glucokinase
MRIKAVALRAPGKILMEHKVPSNADQGPKAVRKALGEAIAHFRLSGIEFGAVGVGCAGSVDHDKGVVRSSPNFSDWKDVSIRQWIQEDFNVPSIVENDANCAVYGEWKMGGADEWNNVILLTLGTGIGGGIVLNRQLFRGSTGTGGELGHMSIHAHGKKCQCGNTGCFERYCSASALIEKAGGISAKEIFSRESEPKFREIVDHFLHDFKIGVTSLANIFDPDCILLGGGMSQGVALHLDEIRSWVKEHAFSAVGKHVKIEMTQHKNLSGAIGAALLALHQ